MWLERSEAWVGGHRRLLPLLDDTAEEPLLIMAATPDHVCTAKWLPEGRTTYRGRDD